MEVNIYKLNTFTIMTELFEQKPLSDATVYSKGIASGIVTILKEYCFEGKAKTDGELDDAIRLFVLESAYATSVDIDVNEVVDSIYAELDDFMIKFDKLNEKKQ